MHKPFIQECACGWEGKLICACCPSYCSDKKDLSGVGMLGYSNVFPSGSSSEAGRLLTVQGSKQQHTILP